LIKNAYAQAPSALKLLLITDADAIVHGVAFLRNQ
jgi:hypothetical protein